MKLFAVLLLAGIAMGLAGTAHAQALTMPSRQELEAKGIRPLNGEQLKALLTGNTLYHIVPANGFRVPLLYLPDGSRFVRIKGQQTKSTWRIERDMVCEHSVVLKREVCRALFRSDGANAICEEGEAVCSFGLDWAAGNPEKLGL